MVRLRLQILSLACIVLVYCASNTVHSFEVLSWFNRPDPGDRAPVKLSAQNDKFGDNGIQDEYQRWTKHSRKNDPSSLHAHHEHLLLQRFNISAQMLEFLTDWGVSIEAGTKIPSTVEEVVSQAFAAVAGSIYKKQKMDPNVAVNARSKSIFTQRPVRRQLDAGRIGIEMDGVECLFPNGTSISKSCAIRIVSLQLAVKLAMSRAWVEFFKQESLEEGQPPPIIAVYLNSVNEALAARHELNLILKEKDTKNLNQDSIKIHTIGDNIPFEMLRPSGQRRRYGGFKDGFVDATRGIIVVVQPTDFNVEQRPPRPAIGALSAFQQLVAQAAIEEIAVTVVSPRFTTYKSDVGWDQSLYQKASPYGGTEPPPGPTPWVMRDFTPPAYSWIGDVLQFPRPRTPRGSSEHTSVLSRIAMTQSIMDYGHSWHIFAAREGVKGSRSPSIPTEYFYLLSTQAASGRPTTGFISKILENSK